jgi:hypothetical protein
MSRKLSTSGGSSPSSTSSPIVQSPSPRIDSPVFNVKAFGAFGDANPNVNGSGHDDTAAIQAAFNAATAAAVATGGTFAWQAGGSVYFPQGCYRITSNIIVTPPGGFDAVTPFAAFRVYGEGMFHQSTLLFDGAAVTTGLTFVSDNSTYQRFAPVQHLCFEGVNGAVTALTYKYTSAIIVEKCLIHGFANEGLFIENSNTPTVRDCYIYGCGSASHAQVRFNLSTVVKFDHNYISAGATALGGVALERSAGSINNNAIESCGTLIIVSGETESAIACSTVTIADNDLENPLVSSLEATPVHISIGRGLTTVFVRSVRVVGNNGAGNLAIVAGAFGCNVAQCQQFEALANIFSLSSNAGSQYNFSSAAGVLSAIVRAQREEIGYTFPWVKLNGAQVVEATPYADWCSLQATSGLQFPKLVTTNPTATLNNKQSAQGGLYQIIHIGNAGGALTVNVTSDQPLNSGYPMMLMPTDTNITLAHNFAVKGFFLKGLANLALTLTNPVFFVYNSTTGKWHQL